jgi:hypothetical protein
MDREIRGRLGTRLRAAWQVQKAPPSSLVLSATEWMIADAPRSACAASCVLGDQGAVIVAAITSSPDAVAALDPSPTIIEVGAGAGNDDVWLPLLDRRQSLTARATTSPHAVG